MIKRGYVIAAAAVAGAVVAGAFAVRREIKRRRNRVISPDVRKLMLELIELQGSDFIPQKAPGGGLGKSVFFRRIERLDDRQLMAVFAIVEVGYFLKASGIDPLHPSKEQIKQVAQKFGIEFASAPKDRAALLGQLDTTDAHDALAAAFRVLGKA